MAPDPTDNPEPESKADRLKSLRRKLSKLDRAPLPETDPPPRAARPEPVPRPRDAIVYSRSLPQVESHRTDSGGAICIPLEECLEGCLSEAAHGPGFYLLERAVADAEPESAHLSETLVRAVERLSMASDAASVSAGEVCFMDIETTGLGCTPVFLIGALVWRDGGLLCRQFLARTYAEEASILSSFADQARRSPCFVTFNGKSFDVPFLRMRGAATGVAMPEPQEHFDLLHEARRVFKGRLPDCKLQTLERYVCQRYRGADIPGSDIARAYHDFVRSGDAREMALIVKHNLWDLVTMVHLMTRVVLGQDACGG